jgi:hypothetical protein
MGKIKSWAGCVTPFGRWTHPAQPSSLRDAEHYRQAKRK